MQGVKQICFTPKFFIMEKDLHYVELFELYQSLLTERQRELFRSHYYFDLSLAEIAEDVEYFAKQEGLTAHARSAVIRFEEEKI